MPIDLTILIVITILIFGYCAIVITNEIRRNARSHRRQKEIADFLINVSKEMDAERERLKKESIQQDEIEDQQSSL